MTRRSAGIVAKIALVCGLTACAPGLNGSWDASGRMGEVAQRFQLSLSFDDEQGGLAVYTTPGAGERTVPVCALKVEDASISFQTDLNGGAECSTLAHPLTFNGALGHDVLAGSVFDAAGKEVGLWRAFRRQPE